MSNLLRLIQTMKPRKKGKGWLCCVVHVYNYTNHSSDIFMEGTAYIRIVCSFESQGLP